MKKFIGHINILNMTIYGDNAMHYGVRIYTKKFGYICFRLPVRSCGRWWPLYFYCSPDATPQCSTFMLGRRYDEEEWVKSRIRYLCLGHNFQCEWDDDKYRVLRGINRSVSIYKGDYYRYQQEHPERD